MIADRKHFGIASLFATGSPRHIDQLRELARKRGLSLTEEGLRKASRIVSAASEPAIYRALGLPYIPPELREGRDETERALEGTLPRLVWIPTCVAFFTPIRSCPDAHATDEIDVLHWGVVMARKGGVPPDRVLNCMALSRLTTHLQRRRR